MRASNSSATSASDRRRSTKVDVPRPRSPIERTRWRLTSLPTPTPKMRVCGRRWPFSVASTSVSLPMKPSVKNMTIRSRAGSLAGTIASCTAARTSVPPPPQKPATYSEARATFSLVAFTAVGASFFTLVSKSSTWKVSSGRRWRSTSRVMALDFSMGAPAWEPEVSSTKYSSRGTTSALDGSSWGWTIKRR